MMSDEDIRDAELAKQRLEEIKQNPSLLISGNALRERLWRMLEAEQS